MSRETTTVRLFLVKALVCGIALFAVSCGDSGEKKSDIHWVQFDTIKNPASLGVDFQGRVWVSSSADGTVGGHAADGPLTDTFEPGGILWDLAIDGLGRLWMVDDSANGLDNGTIQRMTSEGETTQFVSLAKRPRRIALEPTGSIWVATETTLQRFNESGESTSVFDLPATALDLAIDGTGALWVLTAKVSTGSGGPYLMRFSPSGATLVKETVPTFSRRLALAPDGFVVVQDSRGRVHRFNELGSEVRAYESAPPGYDAGSALGIAVSQSGDVVFVTDTHLNVLSSEMELLGSYSFVSAEGIALDVIPRDIAIGVHGEVWLISGDPIDPLSSNMRNTSLYRLPLELDGVEFFPDETMIWPY